MAAGSNTVVIDGRPWRWIIFGLTLGSLIGGLGAAESAAAAATVLPSGGTVQTGAVHIGAPSGSTLTVTQTTARAVINWKTFSIGAGGMVQFNNGSGATLNRVTGLSASTIDGLLSGTGSVYLINPNGVIIDKSGKVNVGGTFAASTLAITNAAFMAGGALTFAGTSKAAVINYGKIGSLGGDVALIAAKVENDGEIDAAKGDVGLASGYQVILRDAALNDGKFAVLVGGAGTSATNSGVIQAADAELRANGGNVYALAGNSASIIKATGVAAGDGKVFLVATGGALKAAGPIVARGPNGAGGTVQTLGGTVDVSAAAVDVGPGGVWVGQPAPPAPPPVTPPAASAGDGINAYAGGSGSITITQAGGSITGVHVGISASTAGVSASNLGSTATVTVTSNTSGVVVKLLDGSTPTSTPTPTP